MLTTAVVGLILGLGAGYALGYMRGYVRGANEMDEMLTGWRETALTPPSDLFPEQNLDDVLEVNRTPDLDPRSR